VPGRRAARVRTRRNADPTPPLCTRCERRPPFLGSTNTPEQFSFSPLPKGALLKFVIISCRQGARCCWLLAGRSTRSRFPIGALRGALLENPGHFGGTLRALGADDMPLLGRIALKLPRENFQRPQELRPASGAQGHFFFKLVSNRKKRKKRKVTGKWRRKLPPLLNCPSLAMRARPSLRRSLGPRRSLRRSTGAHSSPT
jgi:hypothetical protein